MNTKLSEITFGVLLILGLIVTSFSYPTSGKAQNAKNISIAKQWLRATPPAAKAGGGYLRITNNGAQSDTLVAVAFDGAKKSEIHEMKMADGVMIMRPLTGGIEIPAGNTTVLKPGGEHLMLMGLKTQLKDGENKKITLTFAKAGEIEFDFPVLSLEKGRKFMSQEE